MYCTVKEIIREVLDTDVPDSECVFAVVLTRGDVRHIAQDWNLSDDELETVMQRLDDAFEHGADVSVVHDVVRELMEEKRASRQVTVPAVMLEKVMALAGSEMKRLYAVGSENGGDGDAFVREEREAMDVVLQALDGSDVMNISTETREILRNYRAVINARRREMGQKPLTTAQIVDEICDFVANQQAFSSAVSTSSGQQKQVIQGQAVEAVCQPARTPWQADACRKGSGPR
ncbi:YcjA [Escherichia coli]|nr:YcjA [Escherichia coli]